MNYDITKPQAPRCQPSETGQNASKSSSKWPQNTLCTPPSSTLHPPQRSHARSRITPSIPHWGGFLWQNEYPRGRKMG